MRLPELATYKEAYAYLENHSRWRRTTLGAELTLDRGPDSRLPTTIAYFPHYHGSKAILCVGVGESFDLPCGTLYGYAEEAERADLRRRAEVVAACWLLGESVKAKIRARHDAESAAREERRREARARLVAKVCRALDLKERDVLSASDALCYAVLERLADLTPPSPLSDEEDAGSAE